LTRQSCDLSSCTPLVERKHPFYRDLPTLSVTLFYKQNGVGLLYSWKEIHQLFCRLEQNARGRFLLRLLLSCSANERTRQLSNREKDTLFLIAKNCGRRRKELWLCARSGACPSCLLSSPSECELDRYTYREEDIEYVAARFTSFQPR